VKRWRVNLYIIWFAQIISLTSFGFGIPFLPFYIQEMGVTDPDKLKLYTGLLNAAPSITMGIMAPVWGYLADRYGKKLMLLRSMFFGAVLMGAMGLAIQAEQLIALRFIQGLFTGTVTAAAALIASNTPDEHLSYALGFLSSSTFIGNSTGPVLGGFIAEYAGYRYSFFIGAGLMMINFILVYFIVHEEKVAQIQPVKEEKQKISIRQTLTPLITTMLIILFFLRITRSVFSPYMPLYIQEMQNGLEGAAQTTGVISGITGLVTALSGLIVGRLGDRYDKKSILVILVLSSVIIALPLFFANNLWSFTIVYALLFFALGGVEPMIMSMTSESVSSDRRGVLFGIQALVGSIGWGLSPFIGSYVSIHFSIRAVTLLIPIFLTFALGTALAAKYLKNGTGHGLSV